MSDKTSIVKKKSGLKVLTPLPSFSLARVIYALLLVFIVAICVLLLVFRYIGLPEKIGDQITQELLSRGIKSNYDHLFLTPFGGVVAKNLVVTQTLGLTTKTLKVEELRFGFNWISWWRGEPFLSDAQIFNANLIIPLNAETFIQLRNVKALIVLKPSSIEIESLEADLLNIHLKLNGSILTTNYKPKEDGVELDLSSYAKLWSQIETVAAEVDGVKPLLLELNFKFQLANPKASQARMLLSGQRQSWRGVVVEKLGFDAEFLDDRITMNGEIALLRGSMQVEGNWNIKQKKTALEFYSNVDLSLLANLMPAQVRNIVKEIRFRSLPVNEGSLELNWEDGFKYLLLTRSDWKDFSIQGNYFNSLYCPISFDGKRVMITEMVVETASGQSTLSAFYDGDKILKAKMRSMIDPTSVKKLFGEKAQPFFNSLKFNETPLLDCSLVAEGLKLESVQIKGAISASNFSYKSVPIEQLSSSFEFKQNELHLPDLHIKRVEGEGSGEIWHNLKTMQVRMKGVKGKLKIREVATIIGDKMSEYAQPYAFYDATEFQVDGVVDLDKQIKTDLKATIKSSTGLDYVFLGKKLTLKKIDAGLTIKGKELRINQSSPLQIFNGELDGKLLVVMDDDPTFLANLKFKDQEFGSLMKTFFSNQEVSGSLTGTLDLRGSFSNMGTLQGIGDFTVTKGLLYNIPIFGGFSDILNSIIPNLGYTEASQANANFIVRDGVVEVQKVDVYSTAFALIGKGSYDIVKDDVNMNMRINLRGVLGIPMFFVSKLFEYEGKGTLGNTKWAPKVF